MNSYSGISHAEFRDIELGVVHVNHIKDLMVCMMVEPYHYGGYDYVISGDLRMYILKSTDDGNKIYEGVEDPFEVLSNIVYSLSEDELSAVRERVVELGLY